MKLTDVRLLVSDIEACRAFYKDKLELKEQVAVEGVYYEFLAGEGVVSIYKRKLMEGVLGQDSGGQVSGDRAVVVFLVEDVDQTYAKLQGRGVAFITQPHNQEAWALRVAHLRDPEGNLIEIYKRLKQ
ncbi:MAG TPA: VOC family protein [Anaerolineales bacterium]